MSYIPVKKSQIPRPKSALKWTHLHRICEMIMPLNAALEVGLFIGLNCPRAIKPLEVILGKEGDPYAKEAALGWGGFGNVRPLTSEYAEARGDIARNRIVNGEIQGERCATLHSRHK